MADLEYRELPVSIAVDPDLDKREVTGIAVPWDQVTTIGGGAFEESFDRGAVVDSEDALLFWRHSEPIGRIVAAEDTDAGWQVTARISATPRGEEAYTLLRDGVIRSLSVGFKPIASRDQDGVLVRTKVQVREVSLVPMPAYAGATISQVRSEAATTKENTMTDTTVTAADLDEVRGSIDDLSRRIDVAVETREAPTAPQEVFSSIGDMVKRVAAGEETAVRAYNEAFQTRDYDGATSSDAVLKAAWIGSLVEIIKKRRPVLSTFATGVLPPTGLSVEYAALGSDTTQVGVQADEGDDLAFGKVSITTDTAPVVTLGGWSSMSRQAIERANVGILDTTWEALVEKYGSASETYARGILSAAIAATGPAALAEIEAELTTQDGVVAAVLDLAEHFESVGRSLDGVFVAKDVFLALYAVEASDRILQVSGQPADKVGSLTVQTASGSVANLPFKLLPGATAGTTLAYDRTAIKSLEAPGAPFRLQDENIVNLTKDFSLYGYLASFVQKRAGLVRVVEEA